MEKILVIIAHPNLSTSTVNKRWVQELQRYPERFTLHDIYAAYPDGKIDIKKEQQLLEAHRTVVWQFPLYWYNVTPLLKQWIDDVFIYGWAYGTKGDKLVNTQFAAAISVGSPESAYTPEGYCGLSVEQLLAPLLATTRFVKAKYCQHFAVYGTLQAASNQERLEQSAQDYINYLNTL